MNNNKKALKSGIWYTISNFILKTISFITIPIFARILTKDEFGTYNNYLSWLSIMTVFVTLNLESTLISARFDFEEKFDEYILSILCLSTLSAMVWVGIINVFNGEFVMFFDLESKYINIMILYLIFLPVVNIFQSRERFYFEYKKSVSVAMGLAIGSTILSLLLVINMENKIDGRIYGMVMPTIILGLLIYVYFIVKARRINVQYWKYAIPICLPYIPHLLSMTLLNSTDRVMITKICGSEDNAMYSLAYTCGTMITLLLTSLNGAFAPWLAEKINEYKYKEINDFSKIYIVVFLYFAIGVMLVSPEVLYVVGGKHYMEAKYVMTPVTMGCVCQFLYTMFVNVEQFRKKTRCMAFASLTAAFINLLLNYLLIPQFGYLAAAYTTLVGYICLLIMHMFLVYRIERGRIFDYRFIGMVIVLGILLMLLITILYSYNIIRYCILVLYLALGIVILVKKKYELMKLLSCKNGL